MKKKEFDHFSQFCCTNTPPPPKKKIQLKKRGNLHFAPNMEIAILMWKHAAVIPYF
jgi:hypothetical protein